MTGFAGAEWFVSTDNNNNFDPFLSCNSHHVYPEARRSHPLVGLGGSARASSGGGGAAAASGAAAPAAAGAAAQPNAADGPGLRPSNAAFPTAFPTAFPAANILQASPDIAATSLYNFFHDIINGESQVAMFCLNYHVIG